MNDLISLAWRATNASHSLVSWLLRAFLRRRFRRLRVALRERFAGAAGVALLDENLLHPDQEDYRDTLHFTPAAYRKLESAALTAISAL